MESDFTLLVPGTRRSEILRTRISREFAWAFRAESRWNLRLTRIVKQAELVRVDNQAAGADLLRTGQINAYAAPRPALLGMSGHLSGSHVLEDSFATISFAAFVPKGHDWESGIRRRVRAVIAVQIH